MDKRYFGDGNFSRTKISEEENQKLKEELEKLRADNILLQERIEVKIKIEAGAMEEKLP